MKAGITGSAYSLVDASLAALGNLLAGLIAVRILGTEALALYALLFSAAVAAMLVPAQMVYLVQRLDLNRRETRGIIAASVSVRRSARHVAVVVVVVLASGLPLLLGSSDVGLWVISLSAAAWAAISPLQDHVRAQLHVAGLHATAAVVSSVNTLVVMSALLTTPALPPGWAYAAPFGALFLSNLCSLGVASILTPRVPREPGSWHVPWRTGVMSALPAFMLQSAAYASNVVVLLLLSQAALAQLEAARIAAQPVFAAAVGLLSYFGPRIIRADNTLNRRAFRRGLAGFAAVLGAFTASLVVVLISFPGLVSAMLGRPVDSLLAAARSVSFAVRSGSNAVEIIAINRREFGRIIALSGVAALLSFALLPLLVPMIGLYAVPVALVVASCLRLFALKRRRRGA